MAAAAAASTIPAPSSHLIVSGRSATRLVAKLSPFHLSFPRRRHAVEFNGGHLPATRCAAVGTGTSEVETKKTKSTYELQTLTTWLLKQEQSGAIDAELTIVLSSISMACKQIASLVQRANISNLTGVQGAVNVQGEDQKKLDVISN